MSESKKPNEGVPIGTPSSEDPQGYGSWEAVHNAIALSEDDFVIGDRVHHKGEDGTVVAVEDKLIVIEIDYSGQHRRVDAAAVELVVLRPPEFSDEAIALAFAERHADHLRYVDRWGRWMWWDGYVWRSDDTLLAFSRARELCREIAVQCKVPKIAFAIASAKTVAAVERLARADRRLAATVDQWDRDPWLLNTPGGIVDLRTGTMRAAMPADYMSKITPVAPDFDMTIPIWKKFIGEATSGDTDVKEFLQRAIGYTLTGSTREEAIFFLYGEGGNGKGVFIDTVTWCMGDGYHKVAPIELFIVTKTHLHPTVLARLCGARAVTCSETEEGRRWSEAKLKLLSGEDKVTAYFMHKDPFDFFPNFKLWVRGNHKPTLRSVTEAIRRRFHLVAFREKFRVKGTMDNELRERLKPEWPGILAWMIEGCLEWQRTGLAPPAAVRAATDEYLAEQDVFGAWAEERCEYDPNGWEALADLYADLKSWGERNGEYVGSKHTFTEKFDRQFAEKIEAKQIEAKRGTGGAAGFRGIRLKRVASGDDTIPY
jgi:putative DNA primase/helicase